jgi:hypothetical protein
MSDRYSEFNMMSRLAACDLPASADGNYRPLAAGRERLLSA